MNSTDTRTQQETKPRATYRDLRVWQKGMELAVCVHKLTRRFPKEELFGLVADMRGCANDVASGIADGYARGSGTEYVGCLQQAATAVARLQTHVDLCQALDYLGENDAERVQAMARDQSRMLYGLMKAIREKRNGGNGNGQGDGRAPRRP